MINIPVSALNSKADKEFFVEKVGIYIRLVECYAKTSECFITPNEISDDILLELISIGFIASANEYDKLVTVLGKKVCAKLIACVSYALGHPKIMPYLCKIRNHSREECQKKRAEGPKLIDLFCGAGGLSLGFLEAGYDIILANDVQDVCCETYKYNHPEIPTSRVLLGDIRNILDNFPSEPNVDVIIGGPPCQGFSTANQQKVIDDPRNFLYKYFIEAVTKYTPKIVLMENVRGMLKVADRVVEDYRDISINIKGIEAHYIADYKLFNSAKFGVAQSRERLIYIAIRSDYALEKSISPQLIFEEILQNTSSKEYVLQDALDFIKPLSSPRIKGLTKVDSEEHGMKIDFNAYKGNENEYLKLINHNRLIPFVFNHKARYASDINFKIFEILQPGDDATNEKIKGIMPYAHRNHCFKDKYYKLIPGKPCRTIPAHLRMDCLSHIHPFQTRTITPREAARIQSFPDDYLFLGAYLKTYMQVGNAVPPLMAYAFAKAIKRFL